MSFCEKKADERFYYCFEVGKLKNKNSPSSSGDILGDILGDNIISISFIYMI